MAKGVGVSMKKAGTILKHGAIRGRPLTRRQRGFFGAIRGGARLTRLRAGSRRRR